MAVALPSDDDALFEFDIDSCLLTRTTGTAIQRRIDTSGTRSTSSSGGRHILPVRVVANVAALGDEHGPFGLGLLGG